MKQFIRKFIVVWSSGKFMLKEIYKDDILNPSYFDIHDPMDLKVIGNIFDNDI